MDYVAEAYVNHGKWVALCPRKDCFGAQKLEARQGTVQCRNCLLLSNVRWPADADAIWDALMVRPVPETRNWMPADHPWALMHRLPHGQTVAQLRDETAEHMGSVA